MKEPSFSNFPLPASRYREIGSGWETTVYLAEGGKLPFEVAVKDIRRRFRSAAEMRKAKQLYDLMSADPNLSRFVPKTYFVQARKNPSDKPHLFMIQQCIDGRTLRKFSDEESRRDPSLIQELREFIDAAIGFLEKHQDVFPDFWRTMSRKSVGFPLNARMTDNIIVSKRETKTRIQYVDCAPMYGSHRILPRIINKIHRRSLERWKKNMERLTVEKPVYERPRMTIVIEQICHSRPDAPVGAPTLSRRRSKNKTEFVISSGSLWSREIPASTLN